MEDHAVHQPSAFRKDAKTAFAQDCRLQKIAIAMLIAMQACFVILQPPGRI
jgi:hypothetical protein